MLVSVVFYVWAGGIFHCLGRDLRMAELGFSTFSAVSRYLGRDFRSAALGGYDENPVLSCTKKHLNICKKVVSPDNSVCHAPGFREHITGYTTFILLTYDFFHCVMSCRLSFEELSCFNSTFGKYTL